MTQSKDFFRSILDSVSEQIVVIGRDGSIGFVNEAWVRFGLDNACKTKPEAWQTVNYLTVCDASAQKGEKFAQQAADGIRTVIKGKAETFKIEYPCHSRKERRWFMMGVTPLELSGGSYFAISHQNITQRKLAEERVLDLSRIDGLTKIPNRRYFDEFLAEEWKRCSRLGFPVSVAIMDIDHFKLLNDTYGHPAGDACLVTIGETLNSFEKRPGDLFARYGGEEFSFVFGNVTTAQALIPLRKIADRIRRLNFPNKMAPTRPTVTVSLGIATMFPNDSNSEKDVIKAADTNLYAAKHGGRDRIVST